MSKIKLAAHQPHIDMTPMVDLFMLLLTFFMLTTSFKPSEAVQVDTPSSVSEKTTPERDVITLAISKDNKVFFNIDNGLDTANKMRGALLKRMATQYKLVFSKSDIDKFIKGASFGCDIKNLKQYINIEQVDPGIREKLKEKISIGIPMDSIDNQLAWWVRSAREINPLAEVAIKGDGAADYKTVKKVLDLLQDNSVNKFNLTTNLEKVEVRLVK